MAVVTYKRAGKSHHNISWFNGSFRRGGSVARDAGLQNGDVILEVNRQRIRNESDYRAAMEKTKPDQGVLFLVNRKGSMFFVSLKEGK
jgi:S1-C subfamily serine protease